jgi:DNA (cytosine-5)-methyltransferase 1
MNNYKIGGLFSGVGGIEYGFEKAGFKVAWSNEIDKHACLTYKLNFPNHRLLHADIWKLIENQFIHEERKLEDIDVLVGGFPCQAFSVAGHRKGFEDPRGNLFFAIIEFIKKFSPKAILLENVKNLKGHDNGKTFLRIFNELDSLGYSVIHKVLNTAKYTDIPQNRERIFIIGFKNEKAFNHPGLFQSNEPSPCSDNFDWPSEALKRKSIKQVLSRVKVDDKFYYTQAKNYMYNELKKSIIDRNTVYQWRRKYVRPNKSNLCPTLTANMGTGGHNVPLIIDATGGIRKLTPKECFRLQGFNDIKLPNVASSHLYKQAGNSVTVALIQKLANQIKYALDFK